MIENEIIVIIIPWKLIFLLTGNEILTTQYNIEWKDQFKNEAECFNANYNENKNMKKKSEND